jgi:hypothetical protein
MITSEMRLREAKRELHHLELQAEQYRLHLDELGAHPQEASRAQNALEQLQANLERQRKYCGLLEKEFARALPKSGPRVA